MMMRRKELFWMVMAMAFTVPAWGQPQDKEDEQADVPVMVTGARGGGSAMPAIAVDPAFDRYVDLVFLGRAWDKLDPAGLADAGLQLAEGERILLRSHKSFKSETVLQLAVRSAASRRDIATLNRLAKAAEVLKRTELGQQVAAAKKVAGETRDTTSSMQVSLDEVTPYEYSMIRDQYLEMSRAEVTGNKKYLDRLDEMTRSSGANASKNKKIKAQFSALSKAARSEMTDAPVFDPRITDLLDSIAACTRDDDEDITESRPSANVTGAH